MRAPVALLRTVLVAACLVSLPAVGRRAVDVLEQVRQDRLAAALYLRGLSLQAGRQYGEAAEAFRASVSASPRATAALLAMGDVEFRRGRYREAIAAYRQVMARYPYTYIGELHRQVGLFALRGGFLQEAVRELREAVALDPEDWLAYHLLGHANLQLGDRESARAAWEQVLRLNPEFQPAREQLRRLDGTAR
ncbi:MAG: tetratricopeptide repeat protein [Armatimonadota bacterium]|nr:tetratricopeptide repeat protein [Armatimonadota bacterium]MDR7587359.1 tetratricopeptide repeat protein [Armatimonadota bacterium]MDR7611057.1 tetratricopeptide repeat protein [Armatimonadota bacterium]